MSAVLLGALTLGAIRVSLPPEPSLAHQMLPNELGTTWTYRTTMDGRPSGNMTQRVGGVSLVGIQNNWYVDTHWDDFLGRGAPLDQVNYYGRVGRDVVSYGDRSRGTFSPDTPSVPLYKGNLADGQSWKYEGYNGSSAHTGEFTVRRLGDRVVLGQTRRGCIEQTEQHIFLNDETPNDQSVKVVACPGIGMVHSVVSSRSLSFTLEQELTAFRSRDLSLGAVPAAQAPSEPQQGLGAVGVGIDPGRSGFAPGLEAPALDRVSWSTMRKPRMDFPPVGDATTVAYAEQDGQVWAMDPDRGTVRWRTSITKPIPTAPAMGDGLLIVADGNRALFAFDMSDGSTRWIAKLKDVPSASPTVVGDVVVVPLEDRSLLGLRIRDGRQQWSRTTSARVESPPVVTDGLAVVADIDGGMTAVRARDGSTAWDAPFENALAAGPAAGDGIVVASDTSVVTAFDSTTGERRWELNLGSGAGTRAAIADGRVFVFLDDIERLLGVDARSGDVVWNVPFDADIAAQPVVLGDRLVILIHGERVPQIVMVDTASGRLAAPVDVPAPDARTALDAGPGLNVVGDDLLVTLRSGDPWGLAFVLAFPVSPDAKRAANGVVFTGTVHPAPGPPETAVVATPGKAIVMSDWTQKVWSLRPGGGRSLLWAPPGSDKVTHHWVAAGGELAFVQHGKTLRALGPDGEKWRAEMPADAYVGFEPVVADGTVVVPVRGAGLYGLDARSGARRWHLPVGNAVAGSRPVVVGGDVVYAGGGLVRVAAATGVVRWRVPAIESFSPLARGGGKVYVTGYVGEQGMVLAVDERAGTLAWVKPFSGGLLTAPSFGDGILVAADADGGLHAYDAATGQDLWSTPMLGPSNRGPVVRGGIVYAAGMPRREDAYARNAEVVAFDARTGRFLGHYEPFGNPYSSFGEYAASANGVLAPLLTGGGYAVAELEAVRP